MVVGYDVLLLLYYVI